MSTDPEDNGKQQNQKLLIIVGIFILVVFCLIALLAFNTMQNEQTEIIPTIATILSISL